MSYLEMVTDAITTMGGINLVRLEDMSCDRLSRRSRAILHRGDGVGHHLQVGHLLRLSFSPLLSTSTLLSLGNSGFLHWSLNLLGCDILDFIRRHFVEKMGWDLRDQ